MSDFVWLNLCNKDFPYHREIGNAEEPKSNLIHYHVLRTLLIILSIHSELGADSAMLFRHTPLPVIESAQQRYRALRMRLLEIHHHHYQLRPESVLDTLAKWQ